LITADKLKELLHYDPDTGDFTWKVVRKNGRAGLAGTTTNGGYRQIVINCKFYRAHRLAWLYVYGKWPENEIDHINGVRNDNRIANLREATRSENQQNQRRAHVSKKSGLFGATYCTFTKRWQVNIRFNGKQKHIGRFDTPELAHAAYLAAKKKFHPFGEIAK
jgi:hypothetical protein